MNSIMRRTVRGAATGLGALALIAGASACGAIGDLAGGDDEGGDDPSVEQPAENEGSEQSEADGATTEDGDDAEDSDARSDDAGSEESDGADAASGDAEPLSEEDLTAAGDQFFAFVQAAAGGDGATACGLVIDPTTGDPITGSSLDACVDGFDSEAEDEGAPLDPALADMLDRSMIEATDKGDGTAGINMMDSDAGLTMVKADDGKWYVDSEGLL